MVKLDIDEGRIRPSIGTILMLLNRSGYIPRWLMEKRSRSGKGWHIVMALDPEPKTAEEVVALQAVLGSDPYREACNLQRARTLKRFSKFWRERWNVLYD